jgi:hypothetical protein
MTYDGIYGDDMVKIAFMSIRFMVLMTPMLISSLMLDYMPNIINLAMITTRSVNKSSPMTPSPDTTIVGDVVYISINVHDE